MHEENLEVLDRLKKGNQLYLQSSTNPADISEEIRSLTASKGQSPYAIVIACSDSRVIPEAIFCAGIGEIFVIRVAGNVLDNHQLGSIEYAVSHLKTNVVVLLGHTGCGAVKAAIKHRKAAACGECQEEEKFIRYIIDDITMAIGDEQDDHKAAVLNVRHGVSVIRQAFLDHKEIDNGRLDILGAVYNVDTGMVEWV